MRRLPGGRWDHNQTGFLVLKTSIHMFSNIRPLFFLIGLASCIITFAQEHMSKGELTYVESLYVHTDRESYLTGETLWFKAYVLDRDRLTLSRLSKVAYIELLDRENRPVIQQKVVLENGVGSGSMYLPVSMQTSGYALRGYTRWMQNFGPEGFFRKTLTVINPLTRFVSVSDTARTDFSCGLLLDSVERQRVVNASKGFDFSLNHSSFKKRDKVELRISLSEPFDTKSFVHASIAVHQVDSLDKYSNPLMAGYLSQRSDFPSANEEMRYQPEYEGGRISGSLTTSCAEMKLGNRLLFLHSAGEQVLLYATRSGADGQFQFIVDEVIRDPLITVPADSLDCYRVNIQPVYSDRFACKGIAPFRLHPDDLEKIRQRSLNMQIQHAFAADFSLDSLMVHSNVFGTAMVEYDLDDYTRFATLEEIMREYVSEVTVKNDKEEVNFRVIDGQSYPAFHADPLILINGVPEMDKTYIASLDPYKMENIRVIDDKFGIGNAVFYGVIMIQTKESNPHLSKRKGSFSSYTPSRSFNSPGYEDERLRQSQKPDFRTLLHWNPSLVFQKPSYDVSFYTSDIAGTYVGLVQGVDQKGNVATARFTFT
ncbi:MAG: hypothetical protein AAGA66_19745, partial [Bacteroidota bacterium]